MTTKYDPYDPENLRLSPAQQTAKSVVVSTKLKKRREQFALVPMSLWETLNDAPEQTLRLLVYLIHMYWQGGYEPVKLANGMMSINGVPPQSKRRALRDLEARGIIAVTWPTRKSPIVRFLSPWEALLRR
jgi:hypothetical protein